MRIAKIVILVILVAFLLTISLANGGPVTLNLLPDELETLVVAQFGLQGDLAPSLLVSDEALANHPPAGPLSLTVPIYTVVFAFVAIGLLIGYILEWLREHKHRVAMRQREREARVLAREVVKLKDKQNEGKDEVLAILDSAPRKAS